MTKSGIYHFAAQPKIASISEELQNVLILIVCRSLSASYLGGLVLSASKMKLFFVHRKIFQLVDPVQHQVIFSKDLLGEFYQLQPFQVKIYLFFLPKLPTETLKLTPQRRHASEIAALADFFLKSEKSSFVPHSFDST